MADGKWLFPFFVAVCLGVTFCSSDELLKESDEIIRHVILDPEHIIKRRSIDQPLRISLDFLDLSLLENQLTVKAVLQEAKDYFAKTLKVRKTVSKVLLQRRCQDNSYFLKNDSGTNFKRVRFCQEACNSTRKLCGPVDIPEHDLDRCRTCDRGGQNCRSDSSAGEGHNNTDFVLYVTAVGGNCKQNKTIAYGAACQQESALDRPVAGFINICPKKVTQSELNTSYDEVLATIKHEIFHALGFSPSLYAFFRDQNGAPFTSRGGNGLPTRYYNGLYQWSEKTVKEVIRSDWLTSSGPVPHKIYLMVTPKVTEEARRHFNCPTLEGAELENQGGKGTAWAHWEKRLFENEGMTGIFTQSSSFSRITLALMEDTGWYQVDYEMAEPLQWGKNMGCGFVNNSCKAWMKAQEKEGEENRLEPFCNILWRSSGGVKTACSIDRASVAKCNLIKYDRALPQEYQYFTSKSIPGVTGSEGMYGGAVDLADYCPYYHGFTWTQKGRDVRTSSCIVKQNNLDLENNFALETYGRSSLCFEQEGKWTKKNCKVRWTASDAGSGCYEYICDTDALKIKILGYKFKCFHKGQKIKIKVEHQGWEYSGTLVCPSCQEVCYDSGIACPAAIKPAPRNSQPVPEISTICSQGSQLHVKSVWYEVLLVFVYVIFLFTEGRI